MAGYTAIRFYTRLEDSKFIDTHETEFKVAIYAAMLHQAIIIETCNATALHCQLQEKYPHVTTLKRKFKPHLRAT